MSRTKPTKAHMPRSWSRRSRSEVPHEAPTPTTSPPIEPRIGKAELIDMLRTAARRCSDLVVVRIERSDPSFDWTSLTGRSYSRMPSLNEGQYQDRRYPTDGKEGLHEHVFPSYSEFHLDTFDPSRKPIRHLHSDTDIMAKTGGALLIGVSSGLMLGLPLIGAGIVGAAAGAARAQPKRRRVFSLKALPLAGF